MRILITNDDGINSPGLDGPRADRAHASPTMSGWSRRNSTSRGLSHSLSLNDPLRLRKIGDKHFAVRGTPSDCVIMAIRRLLADRKPDLVLSGVNSGANMADDVTYSGTVAGAIEGTLLGVRSIAVSQAYTYHEDEPRRAVGDGRGPRARTSSASCIAFGFPDGVFYNLNFPNCAPDAVGRHRRHPAGQARPRASTSTSAATARNLPYYWLIYRRAPTVAGPGSDVEAVEKGMISMTPLRIDMTADDLARSAQPLSSTEPAGRCDDRARRRRTRARDAHRRDDPAPAPRRHHRPARRRAPSSRCRATCSCRRRCAPKPMPSGRCRSTAARRSARR